MPRVNRPFRALFDKVESDGTWEVAGELPLGIVEALEDAEAIIVDYQSVCEEAAAALMHLGPPAPDHVCGSPDAVCGGECVEYARHCALLKRLKQKTKSTDRIMNMADRLPDNPMITEACYGSMERPLVSESQELPMYDVRLMVEVIVSVPASSKIDAHIKAEHLCEQGLPPDAEILHAEVCRPGPPSTTLDEIAKTLQRRFPGIYSYVNLCCASYDGGGVRCWIDGYIGVPGNPGIYVNGRSTVGGVLAAMETAAIIAHLDANDVRVRGV